MQEWWEVSRSLFGSVFLLLEFGFPVLVRLFEDGLRLVVECYPFLFVEMGQMNSQHFD